MILEELSTMTPSSRSWSIARQPGYCIHERPRRKTFRKVISSSFLADVRVYCNSGSKYTKKSIDIEVHVQDLDQQFFILLPSIIL